MKKRPVLIVASLISACAVAASCQDNKGEKKMSPQTMIESPFGALEFPAWNQTWNDYKYSNRASLERLASEMQEAGVSILRMDFLWEDIEPRQGEFAFERYDTIVDIMAQHHIQILGLLDYCAGWASDTGQWNNPPRDNQLLVRYASKVIEHYKGKITYWELWNEPDSPVYWLNQDGLVRYCGLLRDVYTAAKKANPGCKILNGGFSQAPLSISRLYDNGAKDFFDILNIHIFATPFDTAAIASVKANVAFAQKIMKRNGDGDKKLWITEIGCPGVKARLRVDNWWMGRNPDERMQAAWVTTVFTNLVGLGPVEKVFWAFFRDCNGHWGNGVDYFGLIRWDYSRKPAYNAYRRCVEDWRKREKRR
jgi:hypothetical protein